MDVISREFSKCRGLQTWVKVALSYPGFKSGFKFQTMLRLQGKQLLFIFARQYVFSYSSDTWTSQVLGLMN